MPPLLSTLILDDRLRMRRVLAALALSALIIAIGSIPGARAEVALLASGLVLHSVAYSCVTFLMFTGCEGSRLGRATKAVLTVLVIGAIDEFVQSFLPYRHAAVSDWLVDGAAAIVTAGLLWALLPDPVHDVPA
ncbi:MAG: VanZ family protein [Massilia sp.]